MKYAIEFNEVWKKYKKGEKINSLRDAIPRFFSNKNHDIELKEKEFWALKNVSFNIDHGEVVGIMGPNGAGKSTVLKLLSKIMNPNKGSMKINGRLAALIEVTAGFHPDLTGRENVYLNGTILGMRTKEIDKKFDEIVEFSGVEEFIDTPVKRYSSGMYSRLGFSVAAHMDPDILLVDEILSVGDIAFQAKCASKIRDLLSSGATVLLVSHQLNMIQSLCKRLILLKDGEMVKDGKVDEVIPYYQNIVFKKNEDDLRLKMNAIDGRVRIDKESLMEITQVSISNGKESKLKVNDPIEIQINYDTKVQLDNPVFLLEIIRADGVLCCSCSTNEDGINAGLIEGKGLVKVNIDKMFLAPGIYMAKISVWDKEMIHPYIVHNRDVFRIEYGNQQQTEGLFLIKANWSIDRKKQGINVKSLKSGKAIS